MRGRLAVALCVMAGLGTTAAAIAPDGAPAHEPGILGLPLPLPWATPTPEPSTTPAPSPEPEPTSTPIADVPIPDTPRDPEPLPAPEPAGEAPLVATHTRGFVKHGRRLAITVAATETCSVGLYVAAKNLTGPAYRFTLPEGKPVRLLLRVPRRAKAPLRLMGTVTDDAGTVSNFSRPVRAVRRR